MENQPQQPSSTSLCRGGCGFFGSAAQEGLCSKCFKDTIKRKQDTARLSPTVALPIASSSAVSEMASATSSSSSSSSTPATGQTCAQAALATEEVTAKLESAVAQAEAQNTLVAEVAAESSTAPPPAKKANRCLQCKKRVGLTGFSCRCGGLYCSEHRYDSAHGCTFDYKSMEREELRKNNPVVVSDKIQRI